MPIGRSLRICHWELFFIDHLVLNVRAQKSQLVHRCAASTCRSPRHGAFRPGLGLWHDGCESPGREEDGQVLRNVAYPSSQTKRFASNLYSDFILEIPAHPLVRPGWRDGITKRPDGDEVIATHRH